MGERDFSKTREMGFEELSVREMDLIATLRRLERRYGEENVQTLVFLGDLEDADRARSLVLAQDTLDALPYAGENHYVLFRVPADPSERAEHREEVLGGVEQIYDAYDLGIMGDEEDEEDEADGESL